MSISTNKLTIGYGQKVVQSELSFSLVEGEMVAMLGPNGCGKSTLLRTLAGLQPKLGGSVEMGEAALVLTEHEAIGQTSVHDVVAMGRYHYTDFLGGLSEADEQIVADALRAVGMKSCAGFADLSDGEKQRVLIAKALAQQTNIILLDEPTAHLDLPNRILTLRLLRELAHREQKTILISTHELELALALCDRVLLMSPASGGIELDKASVLRERGAFDRAFGLDIFHPLEP